MDRSPFAGFFALSCLLAFTGCATSVVKPPGPATAPSPAEHPLHLTTKDHVPTDQKIDNRIARDDAEIIFQLDIYQLTVPFGAVSSNTRFWKHVDEDHVDLATHALLLKNGVRYGIGPNDEWSYFKSLIDQYGATARKGSVAPIKKGSIELPMRTNIREQDIFFFIKDHGPPPGRTYENCDNLLSVTFEPTPRHPGDARIAISALVRGLRKEYKVTILNEAREIEFASPEYLYDLRLRQDVQRDHFLILAPSPEAELPDVLGHAFFVRPNGAEPVETVLLLVPRPFIVSK